MGWQTSIIRGIDYIEQNLENDRIRTKDVAEKSNYSLFHFHRMFYAVTGLTIKDYIKSRRLTEAARRLVETDARIIDISFDTGFESQESFTRAFKQMFGITPGRFRKDGMHYPTVYTNRFDRRYIKLRNKGGMMTPRITETKAAKIVGLRYYGMNRNNEIPELWHRFLQRMDEVEHLGNPCHMYGLCSCPESDNEIQADQAFEYVAGREVSDTADLPKGMVAREIPGGTFAVFTHKGPLSNLKSTYDYIYGQWAEETDYTLAKSFDFEFYDENFDAAGSQSSELYIYVPVNVINLGV